jgi:hypothetical protein
MPSHANAVAETTDAVNAAAAATDKAATTVEKATEVVGSAVDAIEDIAVNVTPQIQSWSAELLSWVQSGVDFTAEQVPLLVEEVILWGIAENALWVLIFGTIAGVAGFISRKFWNAWGKWSKKKGNTDDEEAGCCAGFIVCAAISLLFSIFSLSHLITAVQAYVAPRLYLIEYLTELSKKL